MKRDEARTRTFLLRNAGYRLDMELAIPAAMLWHVVYQRSTHDDLTDDQRNFFKSLLPLLAESVGSPFDRAPPALHIELGKCAGWLAFYAFDIPETGRAMATLLIASVRWLNRLIDSGYMQLNPDSSFATAAGMLIDDVNRAAAADTTGLYDKAFPAADKLASRIQTRLESFGLYKGGCNAAN